MRRFARLTLLPLLLPLLPLRHRRYHPTLSWPLQVNDSHYTPIFPICHTPPFLYIIDTSIVIVADQCATTPNATGCPPRSPPPSPPPPIAPLRLFEPERWVCDSKDGQCEVCYTSITGAFVLGDSSAPPEITGQCTDANSFYPSERSRPLLPLPIASPLTPSCNPPYSHPLHSPRPTLAPPTPPPRRRLRAPRGRSASPSSRDESPMRRSRRC